MEEAEPLLQNYLIQSSSWGSGCALHIRRWIIEPVLTIPPPPPNNWIDWLIVDWVWDLTVPMHLGLIWWVLCAPCRFVGALLFCLSSKWPPDLYLYCPLAPRSPDTHVWVKPKFHSHRMQTEVSSSAPHLLHSGLSDSPIRWRCLLRVLCPVRRPITALDCVLFKDINLALAPRQGPEISSQACLRMSPRTRHHIQCWLTNQRLILLCISCLETPKAGSGSTNFRAGPSLESSLAISFPHTPTCPGTQYSPTECRVDPQPT